MTASTIVVTEGPTVSVDPLYTFQIDPAGSPPAPGTGTQPTPSGSWQPTWAAWTVVDVRGKPSPAYQRYTCVGGTCAAPEPASAACHFPWSGGYDGLPDCTCTQYYCSKP